MDRYLENLLRKHPSSKIALISGPRQVGKTTLTKELFKDHVYLNWDNLDHRQIILSRSWSRTPEYLILDEIHKMPNWKSWLKGIFDVDKERQKFIVTGSARLNTFKKVGDSLAGRFFSYTLHPFDLQETKKHLTEESQELRKRLLQLSGFPEPFLANQLSFYNQWHKSHLDIILRQDLLDLKSILEIPKIELLIESLRSSVGSSISYRSLAEDLQVSDYSIKSWIQLLEDLYVIFRLTPYSKNIKRAILKSPKIYFFNTALTKPSMESGMIENLVAQALIKELDHRNDSGEGNYELKFLRTRAGQEIDFLILSDQQPILMLEVKTSDSSPSKNFQLFAKTLTNTPGIQLVLNLNSMREYESGLKILSIDYFLENITKLIPK